MSARSSVVNGVLTSPKERRSFKPEVESSILSGRISSLPGGTTRDDAKVQIRPATPDDAAAVGDLVQRAYAHYVDRIGRRPGPMDEDYRRNVAEGKVSVAVEGDEILGLIVLAKESAAPCSPSPRRSPPEPTSQLSASTPTP